MTEVEQVIDAITFASRMFDETRRSRANLPTRPATKEEIAETLLGVDFEVARDQWEYDLLTARMNEYLATLRAETSKLAMKS